MGSRQDSPRKTLRSALGRAPTRDEISAWNEAIGWISTWCERQETRHAYVPSIDNMEIADFARDLDERVLSKAWHPEPKGKV